MIEQHYTPRSELDPDMLNDNNAKLSESVAAAVRAAVVEELAAHEAVDTALNAESEAGKETNREVLGNLVAKVLESLASPTGFEPVLSA
jgi:hypothetical protein